MKIEAYKKMYPSRSQVINRIVLFKQNWYDLKISTISKHLSSANQGGTEDQQTVSALESLILLCIHQCKEHLSARGTRRLVQWGALSGLNADIIQGFGVWPNLKMRMMIGRYSLGLFFEAIENGMIEYIHVGSDSQKMIFQQKWINFFIRYTIEGLPVTTTLGVQCVFGHSTGANLRQLFEDLVTGQHLQSEIQTGKTLHEGLSSDSDDESTPSHPKHIFDRLRSNGVKCGMDWDVFLEKLASISTDGGSDFAGKHQGFTGLLRSEVTTHTLNSYWCCAHVWDLISTDLSNNPDVDVFRLSDSFLAIWGKGVGQAPCSKMLLRRNLYLLGLSHFPSA